MTIALAVTFAPFAVPFVLLFVRVATMRNVIPA